MILEKIRAQTSACHVEMEEALDLFNRIKTLSDYTNLLQKWLSFLEPFEKRIQENPGWKDFSLAKPVAERKKCLLLRDDLEFFGVLENNEKPRATDLPSLLTFENVVGFTYVMEGSTLGGQFISKHFRQKFDLSTERGTRFFSGYGPSNGMVWKDFCRGLEAWALRPEVNHQEVILSAVETFKTLQNWLCHDDNGSNTTFS